MDGLLLPAARTARGGASRQPVLVGGTGRFAGARLPHPARVLQPACRHRRPHRQGRSRRCRPDSPQAMVFYGVGNHGGGPTRANLDSIRRLDDLGAYGELVLSSPQDYVDAVRASGADLPVWQGDLQHHAAGCYSAHSGIKAWMRSAEHALLVAEKWAAVAGRVAGTRVSSCRAHERVEARAVQPVPRHPAGHLDRARVRRCPGPARRGTVDRQAYCQPRLADDRARRRHPGTRGQPAGPGVQPAPVAGPGRRRMRVRPGRRPVRRRPTPTDTVCRLSRPGRWPPRGIPGDSCSPPTCRPSATGSTGSTLPTSARSASRFGTAARRVCRAHAHGAGERPPPGRRRRADRTTAKPAPQGDRARPGRGRGPAAHCGDG